MPKSEPGKDERSAPLGPQPADLTRISSEIRTLTAEVWQRVQEWHDAPDWQDAKQNQYRYDLTARAVEDLAATPDPENPADLHELAKAVQPILTEWRPALAGPEQAIYAAVDRLRAAWRMPD